MSSVRLPAPKRRRGPRPAGDPPLPVPTIAEIGSLPTVDDWNFYTGDLVDDHVLVRHTGDMDFLYRMGFFGKGNISRNKPEYNEEFWPIRKRRKGRNEDVPQLRVVSKRQYLSHLAWKKQQMSPCPPSHDDSNTSQKPEIKQKKKPFSHGSQEPLPLPGSSEAASERQDSMPVTTSENKTGIEYHRETKTGIDSHQATPGVSHSTKKASNQSEAALQTATGSPTVPKEISDWPSQDKEDSDPWAETDRSKAKDPWALEIDSSKDKDFWALETDSSKSKDVWSLETETEKDKLDFWDPPVSTENPNNSTLMYSDHNIDKTKKADNRKPDSESTDMDTTSINQTTFSESSKEVYIEGESFLQTSSLVGSKDHKKQVKLRITDLIEPTQTASSERSQQRSSTCDPAETNQLNIKPDEDSIMGASVPQPHDPKEVHLQLEPSPENLHPICMEEHQGGNLCVIDDSDEDDDGIEKLAEGQKTTSWDQVWIPTQKLDPYPLNECLQLTFEEAFFLSYGLGCLVVQDESKEPMSLTKLWQTFCVRRKNFIPNYVAYHSLRSRGWVPKTGIKYGADFIIYHKGPPYYHGSHSVLVRTANQPDLHYGLDPANPTLTWASLMGADRVTESVGKEPLLLFVIRPRDLTEEEMMSPNCVRRFKVQEMLLRRWIPSKEREAAEVAEWL